MLSQECVNLSSPRVLITAARDPDEEKKHEGETKQIQETGREGRKGRNVEWKGKESDGREVRRNEGREIEE